MFQCYGDADRERGSFRSFSITPIQGRVGRGTEQSYCMLLAERPSDIGKERLDLIEKTHNGFLLAEEDLKLRGPGEFSVLARVVCRTSRWPEYQIPLCLK